MVCVWMHIKKSLHYSVQLITLFHPFPSTSLYHPLVVSPFSLTPFLRATQTRATQTEVMSLPTPTLPARYVILVQQWAVVVIRVRGKSEKEGGERKLRNFLSDTEQYMTRDQFFEEWDEFQNM